MQYFRVKETANNIRVKAKKGVKGIKYWHLIRNELYTQSEIEKRINSGLVDMAFIKKHFERKEISRKQTYLFFGARFEVMDQTGQKRY